VWQGEPPTDGKTDLNPEGLTAANGKWAQSLATTLQKGGLSCHVLDKAPFRAAMMEKLIWCVHRKPLNHAVTCRESIGLLITFRCLISYVLAAVRLARVVVDQSVDINYCGPYVCG
jgi:hypothetical protein